MQEKIRRTDKVEVDMAVVNELLRHQNEVNHYLKSDSDNQRCNLHPKKDLYPCNACSRQELCVDHKKERDYIKSSKVSYNTSKRRKRQEDKKETKSKILDSHEEKETTYPCEPFDFCCPIKEDCEEGRKCPWED